MVVFEANGLRRRAPLVLLTRKRPSGAFSVTERILSRNQADLEAMPDSGPASTAGVVKYIPHLSVDVSRAEHGMTPGRVGRTRDRADDSCGPPRLIDEVARRAPDPQDSQR